MPSLTPKQFLDYTPQELNGVLFLIQERENNKINAEWERTRIQTWHLINLQLDKNHKLEYEKFKTSYWPFPWDITVEPKKREVDWEELDKRERELAKANWQKI